MCQITVDHVLREFAQLPMMFSQNSGTSIWGIGFRVWDSIQTSKYGYLPKKVPLIFGKPQRKFRGLKQERLSLRVQGPK